MFCAEHELQRLKWSDSSGIRKLTSITFWKSKARKKKGRACKSQPLKSKSRNLPVLTFVHSDLNILSYQSPFDANSIFWIPDSKTYQHSKFHPKKNSYEGDMIFLRWQINSASKQVLWRNKFKLHLEASKPTSKFLFQQFSSSKSKIEDLMQVHFSFFLGK
jgi:hypothetical protein